MKISEEFKEMLVQNGFTKSGISDAIYKDAPWGEIAGIGVATNDDTMYFYFDSRDRPNTRIPFNETCFKIIYRMMNGYALHEIKLGPVGKIAHALNNIIENSIKVDLMNAGFVFVDSSECELFIITANYSIYIVPEEDGPIKVYQKDEEKGEYRWTYSDNIKDSADASNKCFAFLGRHLDFTEKVKDYSWESCFNFEGFWIDSESCIYRITDINLNLYHQNVFKTKAQAEQSLALAQLTYIISAINEDYPKEGDLVSFYPVYDVRSKTFGTSNFNDIDVLQLNSAEACRVLIKTNKPLLMQYYNIKK